MGVQVITPGAMCASVRTTQTRKSRSALPERGTILVDGVAHPFVSGTTVYAGPGVRHKIINDRPEDLKMTWTYLPPGSDNFFAAIGRSRSALRAAARALRAP